VASTVCTVFIAVARRPRGAGHSVQRVSVIVSVVAVVVLVASYLTWLAERLDRLAVRVEAARSALDAQLVRRAAVAHELAHDRSEGGGIDSPELHLAARAAMAARDAHDGTRGVAENALTRALRLELEAPETTPAEADELRAAADRVALARQIHNDGVRDLLALRRRRLIRWLHLYGHAKAPTYLEFDVELPASTTP